jgi:hypothetical protein
MNDLGKLPLGPMPDERLLEELSNLRPFFSPASAAAGIEEKLLRELRKHRPRPQGLARFCRETLGSHWEPVLLLLLFALLSWDLLRIIRYLLS